MQPLNVLRGAITYHAFLTAIEPSEYPYHAADPLRCLHQAATANDSPDPWLSTVRGTIRTTSSALTRTRPPSSAASWR
jgi:hypothetical protein